MLHELAIDKLKFFFGHNQDSAKKKPTPTTTGLASIHFLFPCSLLQAKLLDPNSCESGHAAEHLLSLAIVPRYWLKRLSSAAIATYCCSYTCLYWA